MGDLSDIAAAYGGKGWSPRTETMRQEMGRLWGPWGVASEWMVLRAVLLHRPGPEIEAVSEDPDAVQMLAPIDIERVRREHDALAEAYRSEGVTVHYLEPVTIPPPNTMFMCDLLFMTSEGAVLARPASTVRTGEEVHVARRLADLGVPILRSVRGGGVFEGADALWVDERTVLLTTGLRTNDEGSAQVQAWDDAPAGPGQLCRPRPGGGLAGAGASQGGQAAARAQVRGAVAARRGGSQARDGAQLCHAGATAGADAGRMPAHPGDVPGSGHRVRRGRDRRTAQGCRGDGLPDRGAEPGGDVTRAVQFSA